MLGFGVDAPPPSTDQKAQELLSRPQMSQVLTLKDGSRISFAEVGTKSGFPVLWFAGPCHNRFVIGIFDQIAKDNDLRLICFDRPGKGASTPCRVMKDWSFASFGPILLELVDLLKIKKYSIVAHSMGCMYALGAWPSIKHQVVGSIRCLATWAPTNLPCMPTAYALQRSLPKTLFRSFLRMRSSVATFVMGDIGYREEETLLDPFIHEVLDRSAAGINSEEYKAYEQDWLLGLEINKPFGFSHRTIDCSIKCWHGMEDNISPLGSAMWLQREMKSFLLFAVEGASHNIFLDFSIIRAIFADIKQDVLNLKSAAEKMEE